MEANIDHKFFQFKSIPDDNDVDACKFLSLSYSKVDGLQQVKKLIDLFTLTNLLLYHQN